jgi:predicted nucleic acid-binding protein
MIVTFDTGMLIALTRRKHAAWNIFRRIRERGEFAVVPASCVSEWWRGKSDAFDHVLRAIRYHIEPLAERIACSAGEVLAELRDSETVTASLTIDAQVMASAALRGGGVVYTSDAVDLERLGAFFPTVRVITV